MKGRRTVFNSAFYKTYARSNLIKHPIYVVKVVYSLLSRFGGRWKKIKNKPYSLSSKTNRKPSIKEKSLSKFFPLNLLFFACFLYPIPNNS